MSVAFTAVSLTPVTMAGSGSIWGMNSVKHRVYKSVCQGLQPVWEAGGDQPKEMAFLLILK